MKRNTRSLYGIRYAVGMAAMLTAAAFAGEFVTVSGRAFIDPEGREITLHGMSVINKSSKDRYQSWHGPEQFAQMRGWGMNSIRLGIFWDGVEPEPGKYDDAYLQEVDKRVAWAKANGLYVILDMHQDLYGPAFRSGGDGAPAWATLTGDMPEIAMGSVWSDAYNSSPAIQAAFDNFWANAPAPDGAGVQDHFARAWRHVASRYADEPAVIGYDLFNEPNAGSMNLAALQRIVDTLAELLRERDGPGAPAAPQIMQQWLEPAGRVALMRRLEDMDVYIPVIDAAEDIFAAFEREKLMPMYQRVARAIREVDTHGILFLETSMSANMGILSAITPVAGVDGKRDPAQAFAPHAYDIVVDSADLARACEPRVALIFERHARTARRLDMPMWVGEWGAFGGAGEEVLPAARLVACQLERHKCGDAYWEFGRYVPETRYLQVLQRPYAERVAGRLKSSETDFERRTFRCEWKESDGVRAPSRIYLPAAFVRTPASIVLEPEGQGYVVERVGESNDNVLLIIAPADRPCRRTLRIQ